MNHLVFFASGSGTNFQSVIDAIQSGEIDAYIRGLIVNKAGTGAAERARNNDIPVEVIDPASFEKQKQYEKKLLAILADWQPDLIVLAGYLLKIPTTVIEAYPKKIINIHPSLLPKYGGKGFYGLKVHEAVINGGETETGCSVHVVTEEYDQGPVLGQQKVSVYPSDTPEELAQRVLKHEHKLLPKVIKNYLSNVQN